PLGQREEPSQAEPPGSRRCPSRRRALHAQTTTGWLLNGNAPPPALLLGARDDFNVLLSCGAGEANQPAPSIGCSAYIGLLATLTIKCRLTSCDGAGAEQIEGGKAPGGAISLDHSGYYPMALVTADDRHQEYAQCRRRD